MKSSASAAPQPPPDPKKEIEGKVVDALAAGLKKVVEVFRP